MRTKLLHVAIIGTGKMARTHGLAYQLLPQVSDTRIRPVLEVVCGRSIASATGLAGSLGGDSADDWRSVLSRPDIDLVDICTPTDSHTEIAVAAANAGKHVLCEKPLSASLDGALEVVRAVERADVFGGVVFNYRYVPAVREAKRIIAAGGIGEVRHFRMSFLQDWLSQSNRGMTWRLHKASGGGVLLDLGAHLVDMALHLIGPIAKVVAVGGQSVHQQPDDAGRQQRVDVDDSVHAVVQTVAGAQGTLTVSRVAAGHLCRNGFEIVGSEGSVAWEFENLNVLNIYDAHDAPGGRGWKAVSVTDPAVHPWADVWWGRGHGIGFHEPFTNTIADVVGAIAWDPEADPPTMRDGLACQYVLTALEQSIVTGTWQSLNETAR